MLPPDVATPHPVVDFSTRLPVPSLVYKRPSPTSNLEDHLLTVHSSRHPLTTAPDHQLLVESSIRQDGSLR